MKGNSLNCTVVELKLARVIYQHSGTGRLNCTVVELKHFWDIDPLDSPEGLNCTVVELKPNKQQAQAHHRIVLIVPLWN